MHHLRLHLSNICVHKTNLHVLSIRFVTFLRSLVSRFLSLSLSNGTNSMYIPLLVTANTRTHTRETLQVEAEAEIEIEFESFNLSLNFMSFELRIVNLSFEFQF